ncbi:MAG TPA: AraC family transcriptional regulator [Bacilli bacterium]
MLRVNWTALNPVVTHATYLKCQAGFQFGPRIIYEHQFIYVSKGKGTADIQGRTYQAEEGDLFYYGPQIGHCFRADDLTPFEIVGMHFELIGNIETDAKRPAIAKEVGSTLPNHAIRNLLYIGERGLEELKVPEHIRVNGTGIDELLLKMVNHFRQDNSMTAIVNRGLFLHLLERLHKHTHKVSELLSPQLKILYHLQSRLKQYAELPYSRTWMKQWTGYNEDYLSRNFREQFGVSPHQYHLLQKIEKAKELLAHTDCSITEISGKLHFSSIHYFCRLFKTYTGQSPLQYKKTREMF